VEIKRTTGGATTQNTVDGGMGVSFLAGPAGRPPGDPGPCGQGSYLMTASFLVMDSPPA